MKKKIELTFLIPKAHPSFVRFGERLRVFAEEGDCLLDVALSHAVAIPTMCGGAMACQSCLVDIDEGDFSPASDDENDILHELKAGPNGRLSCQAALKRNATVHLRVETQDEQLLPASKSRSEE